MTSQKKCVPTSHFEWKTKLCPSPCEWLEIALHYTVRTRIKCYTSGKVNFNLGRAWDCNIQIKCASNFHHILSVTVSSFLSTMSYRSEKTYSVITCSWLSGNAGFQHAHFFWLDFLNWQAARAGSQIQWKGLYSGLGGNLVGVLPWV
jgi:hypothetical protein